MRTNILSEKMIKPLQKEHAAQVARLHITGISTGFISSLGERFVTALYEAVVDSPYGFGLVAKEDGRILGFIAFTTNLNQLYKSIIVRKGIRFAFLLAGKMLSLGRMKRIFQTLFYPNRIESLGLPKAELLSIAVSSDARGQGVGKQLCRAGFQECRNRGLEEVKVLVAAKNEAANKLYQACGFEYAAKIENHGIVSNIYVIKTDHFE
jgi:ribosomal protein S18 acetylase RimI-like enzyme